MGNFTSTNSDYSMLTLEQAAGIDTDGQQQDVRVAELIASSLSVLGSGSIIIAVIIKRKVLNPEVYPLFHLSLADLLASLSVFTSQILFDQNLDSSGITPCAWSTNMAWGFYISTFLLTLIYSFEAYRRTRDQLFQLVSPYYSKEPTYSCTPWYLPVAYTLAWAMPFFTVALYQSTQTQSSHQIMNACTSNNYECLVIFHRKYDPCLDSSDLGVTGRLAMKGVFISVFFLCSLGIIVCYFLTHKAVKCSQHSFGVVSHKQYEAAKRIRNRGILYCSVFIICWLPASILGIITFTNGVNTTDLIVLYMLQGCIANLQGFLNCIVYGWIRGGFKSALNLYNIRSSRGSFSSNMNENAMHSGWKRKPPKNYKTFDVVSEEEYDTMSDPDVYLAGKASQLDLAIDVM